MAIFAPGQQTNANETIIGSSVRVEGNFKSHGRVTVDGMVQGSLKTDQELIVGPAAKIKAEVEAGSLTLAGEIRGNVTIKGKAQLAKTARIFGNLTTKTLSIEEGAILHGKCSMEPATADATDKSA